MMETGKAQKSKTMRQYVTIECADCEARQHLCLHVRMSSAAKRADFAPALVALEVVKTELPPGWVSYFGDGSLLDEFRCLTHAREYADANHHARMFGRDELAVQLLSLASGRVLDLAGEKLGYKRHEAPHLIEPDANYRERLIKEFKEDYAVSYSTHKKSAALFVEEIISLIGRATELQANPILKETPAEEKLDAPEEAPHATEKPVTQMGRSELIAEIEKLRSQRLARADLRMVEDIWEETDMLDASLIRSWANEARGTPRALLMAIARCAEAHEQGREDEE